ncbi:MAG: VIT and VWA domain-containing protein [Pseudomonadota bacterium]
MRHSTLALKNLLKSALVFVFAGLLNISHAAGLLTPVDASYKSLEIRDHLVDVTIQDGFVITNVDQVFTNPNPVDLEAVYSFPIPDQAAVSNLMVWIDGQPITGEVVEKQRAREIYEQERQAGRDAGITEQKGFRRFETSVSPVRANSNTRVKIQYLQPARLDTGIGRYVYPLEEGGTDENKLSFWTATESVQELFRFELTLRSGFPVDAVRLPGIADAVVSQVSDREWTVLIERRGGVSQISTPSGSESDEHTVVQELTEGLGLETEENILPPTPTQGNSVSDLTRDLVVYWRLAPNTPGSLEMTAYREPGKSKGTFMMVMSPGDDLAHIEEGRDWVFVLDVSGSMGGKYATLADGVRRAMTKMRPGDRFRLITFNNNARELTPGWVGFSESSVQEFSSVVSSVQPGGGTNLYAGLEKAVRALDKDRTAGIVLVSDGVANVGETQRRGFLKLLERYDIRLFTFILGNEANRPLLKALAKHSNGFAINISNSDDIVGKLLEATSKIQHQAMHDVSVSISGVRTTNITPKSIRSLYRGEQLIVMGQYWEGGEVIVDLDAKISGQKVNYTTRFQLPETSTGIPELERLWAYAKIRDLEDQQELLGRSEDRAQAITDLAVEHSIVSGNTSMVVMREEQFAAYDIQRRNQKRVEKEIAAQSARTQKPVAQRAVAVTGNAGSSAAAKPASEPMFQNSRPSYSGGGSSDLMWLMLLLPLLLISGLRKRAES